MASIISKKMAALMVLGAAVAGTGSAAHAATLLQVDVSGRFPQDGSTTNSGVQPGYEVFTLGAATTSNGAGSTSTTPFTQAVGTYTVSLGAVTNSYTNTSTNAPVSGSGTIDDRDRNFSLPAGSTATLTEIYDDFVFNNSNTGGLRLMVSGGSLAASTQYSISLYSYDYGTSTSVPRTARWVDENNANATVVNTSFSGGTGPTSNDQFKFTGVATTDANGVLSLRGINTSNLTNGVPNGFGVVLNGFEISSIGGVAPEPVTAASLVGLVSVIARRRRTA
jgi:hypothetical protein